MAMPAADRMHSRAVGCCAVALLLAALVAVSSQNGRPTRLTTGASASGGGGGPSSRPPSGAVTGRSGGGGSAHGSRSSESKGSAAFAGSAAGASGRNSLTDPTSGLLRRTTTTLAGHGGPQVAQPAITGRVVDATGQPVANECVEVDAMWLLTLEPSVKTASDGRFEFSDKQVYPMMPPRGAGGAAVTARDCSDRLPGFQSNSQHIDIPGSTPDVTITVAPGAVVTGTLLDAQGVPLAGYCVYAGDVHTTFPAQRGSTDPTGRFTINGVTPGVQPLTAGTDCGPPLPDIGLIEVTPTSTNAVGIDAVVLSVPASEDAFSDARFLPTTEHTMHTIGATSESGEAPPSCFPPATRTVWRLVYGDQPTTLGVRVARGAGAEAIYGHDDAGNLGAQAACQLVRAGDWIEIPFGGPQSGHQGPPGVASSVMYLGYWVQLASGPDPVVLEQFGGCGSATGGCSR
jgi:hypothetical protein